MTFTDQKEAFALSGLPLALTQPQPLQQDSPAWDHHRLWVIQITLANLAPDYSCGDAHIHHCPHPVLCLKSMLEKKQEQLMNSYTRQIS